MPPYETPLQERRRKAAKRGITIYPSDFEHICKELPDRVGIIAEGDSWFSYPRKWIVYGADINIVHHLEDKIEFTKTANLLRLSSNGDEAVDMTSGKQFEKLSKILKKNSNYIHIILFSGGGNDIVGKNDMLPLLNNYESGMGFIDCINKKRFEEKLDSIILAYRRLLDLCEDLIPAAKVITHTYDIAEPWNQGSEFFWGLIKTRPWVYPYLVARRIPREFHLPIMEYMLTKFRDQLVSLAQEESIQERLIVVDTHGTLQPGSQGDWLNEIHPTEAGFEKIFNKIYREMKNVEQKLPD